jgi:hypothetical protein
MIPMFIFKSIPETNTRSGNKPIIILQTFLGDL